MNLSTIQIVYLVISVCWLLSSVSALFATKKVPRDARIFIVLFALPIGLLYVISGFTIWLRKQTRQDISKLTDLAKGTKWIHALVVDGKEYDSKLVVINYIKKVDDETRICYSPWPSLEGFGYVYVEVSDDDHDTITKWGRYRLRYP